MIAPNRARFSSRPRERCAMVWRWSREACGNLAFLLRHAQDMAEVDILPHDFHEAVPLVVDSILGKDDSTD